MADFNTIVCPPSMHALPGTSRGAQHMQEQQNIRIKKSTRRRQGWILWSSRFTRHEVNVKQLESAPPKLPFARDSSTRQSYQRQLWHLLCQLHCSASDLRHWNPSSSSHKRRQALCRFSEREHVGEGKGKVFWGRRVEGKSHSNVGSSTSDLHQWYKLKLPPFSFNLHPCQAVDNQGPGTSPLEAELGCTGGPSP